MGEVVVALWNRLYLATSSELDSLVLALVVLCLAKEVVLVSLKKKSFRTTERMLALEPKIKEIEEKYADDPAELSRNKAAAIIDAGVIPVFPLVLAFSVLLIHILLLIAVFLVFWTPHSFEGYTIVDSLYATDLEGYLLEINRINLFDQLLSQLGTDPLSWLVFVGAELFVFLFGTFAVDKKVNFKPRPYHLKGIVVLFFPAGLWLSRMVIFCIAWPFSILFEQWKAQQVEQISA